MRSTKQEIEDSQEYQKTTFYCQFPPTLRLQPGPSERPRRLHRDAEFGHQVVG